MESRLSEKMSPQVDGSVSTAPEVGGRVRSLSSILERPLEQVGAALDQRGRKLVEVQLEDLSRPILVDPTLRSRRIGVACGNGIAPVTHLHESPGFEPGQ